MPFQPARAFYELWTGLIFLSLELGKLPGEVNVAQCNGFALYDSQRANLLF
jgi:hypothetical protein